MTSGIEKAERQLLALQYLQRKSLERLEKGSGSNMFWWIVSVSFGLYLGLLVLEFM